MNAVLERKAPAAAAGMGPAVVVQPTSPNEIVQILRNPKRFPSPVRPKGSGSSTTRCITANAGTVLDMSKMDRVLRINDDTVTVQPGIALSELAEVLKDNGLELVGGVDLANRTVGGAVCGASVEATIAGDVGQFAGHAVELKVIGPQGKKFVVTNKTKSLLALMRLSYGLLGIVYEITLKIRPVRGFSVQRAKVSFKDFAKLGKRLSNTNAGIKLCLMPFRDHVHFELRKHAEGGSAGKHYAWRLKDWAAYTALPGAAKSLARAMPVRQLRYPLIDSLSEVTQALASMRAMRTGSNATEQSGRFRSLGPGRYSYCTWGFPADQFASIVPAYKLFCKEHYAETGFRCDMPTVGFRLNRDRSALLSPSFGGPMFTLSALSTQTDGWEAFSFDFAEFAMKREGVPFFNQTKHATAECVSLRYANRLAFFNKVRQELDPHNRLLNQYFATYLPQ